MATAVTTDRNTGPVPEIPQFRFHNYRVVPGVRHTDGNYVAILTQNGQRGTSCVVDTKAKGMAFAIRHTLSDQRTKREVPELYVEAWKTLEDGQIGVLDTGLEAAIATEFEVIDSNSPGLDRFDPKDLDRLSLGSDYLIGGRYQISYYKNDGTFRIKDLQNQKDNIEMPFRAWVLLCALAAGTDRMRELDPKMYCKGLQLRALVLENPNCVKPLPSAAVEAVDAPALPAADASANLPAADDERARALGERESALDERERALVDRETAVAQREGALEQGHRDLDERIAAFERERAEMRERLAAVAEGIRDVSTTI